MEMSSTALGPRRRGISQAQLELNNTLRLLWEQHVWWTRSFIIAVAADLPGLDAITERLLRNPRDFQRVLEPLYGPQIAGEFARLLTEHLTIAAELVQEAKAGDAVAAADAERRWYMNADQIARFLGRINPFWSRREWRAMLHEHLDLTKSEAVAILNMNFEQGIMIFGQTERQALMMADVMTEGIVRQFPREFR
ncbi:MAG: acetylglutamate kinase [Bacillota bacterium]